MTVKRKERTKGTINAEKLLEKSVAMGSCGKFETGLKRRSELEEDEATLTESLKMKKMKRL